MQRLSNLVSNLQTDVLGIHGHATVEGHWMVRTGLTVTRQKTGKQCQLELDTFSL